MEAWDADVFATVDQAEAAIHLDGDRPPVTAILSLSLPHWDPAVVTPLMDFMVASLIMVGRCRLTPSNPRGKCLERST